MTLGKYAKVHSDQDSETLTDEKLKELLAEIVAEYFQDIIDKMQQRSKPYKIADR